MIDITGFKTELAGYIRRNEPMALHTTFKVGGPADVWVQPGGGGFPGYAAELLGAAAEAGIPVFILGGGANIVVSDAGIRGIVLDTGGWTGYEASGETALIFRSGTKADAAAETAADLGLTGLEFLAGMPGTIGGAVWMNARCYEKSVSDTLIETEILDESLNRIILPFKAEEYGYKKSPFQNRKVLILSAKVSVQKGEKSEILKEMKAYREDREAKGHYRFPSAGSAFKNNHAFGKPSGKIIDELGLRGRTWGGAQVAPWHGNLIINTGSARSADIRALVEDVAVQVKNRLGIELEPEIRFIGDFA